MGAGREPRQSGAGARPESGGEAGAEPTVGGASSPSLGLGSTKRQHRLCRAKSRRDLSSDARSERLGLYGAGPGGAEPTGDRAGVGSEWRRAGSGAGFSARGRGRGGARAQTVSASSQCYDARAGGGAQEGRTGARGRGLAALGDWPKWCAAACDDRSASAAPLGARAGGRRSPRQRKRVPELCGARTPSILDPGFNMSVPPPPHARRVRSRYPPFCLLRACGQVPVPPRAPSLCLWFPPRACRTTPTQSQAPEAPHPHNSTVCHPLGGRGKPKHRRDSASSEDLGAPPIVGWVGTERVKPGGKIEVPGLEADPGASVLLVKGCCSCEGN